MAENGAQIGMCGDQVLCIGLALRTVDLFHLLEVNVHQIVFRNAGVKAVLTENTVDTGLVQSDLCDLRTGLQLRGDVLADGPCRRLRYPC